MKCKGIDKYSCKYLVALIVSINLIAILTIIIDEDYPKVLAIEPTSEDTPLTQYENPFLGIRFEYPSTWKNHENTHSEGLYGEAFLYVTPNGSWTNNLHIGVLNMVFSKEQRLKQLESMPSFSLIDSRMTTLDKYPAYQVLFTHAKYGSESKELQMYADLNGYTYYVRFSSSLEDFDRIFPSIIKTIDSIKINPPAEVRFNN